MSLIEVVAADGAEGMRRLRGWTQVRDAARVERPTAAPTSWEVEAAQLEHARPGQGRTLLLATSGGRPAAAGSLSWWTDENLHLAEVSVEVDPTLRGAGQGTAVLAELEERARALGRTTTMAWVPAPVDDDGPGVPFAASHGYVVATAETTKTVHLPTLLADRAAVPQADLGGYAVEVFEEPVPQHRVGDVVSLLSSFLGSIPVGSLEMGNAVWTVDRLRAGEARARALGRRRLMAVAVAPGGGLCGFSDLRGDGSDPVRAVVGGTLVLPGHRGRGLALAMKLATHRLAAELFASCRWIETYNADTNTAMNAVNTRLGYVAVERSLGVHKLL